MGSALEILQQTELRTLTSFGVQARARELALLRQRSQLAQLHRWLADRPPLLLGGGSNMLFTDDIEQPVLAVRLQQTPTTNILKDGTVLVHAPAGLAWDTLVQWTLSQHWAGLENLSLIPGSVGASPIQNIGAYGVELRDRFDSLTAWNWRSTEQRVFTKDDCGFGYRDSIFKHGEGKEWLILSVCLRLVPAARAQLALDYGEIKQELAQMKIAQPSAAQVGQAVCAIRRRKLPDPAQLGNAGSFFKNPLVPSAQARELGLQHPSMPQFPSQDLGQIKLSAAWMIDQCGWKGFRDGDAGVHQHHALVLVNYGHASGTQVLNLAQNIQASVWQRFGVRLEAEPTVIPVPL